MQANVQYIGKIGYADALQLQKGTVGKLIESKTLDTLFLLEHSHCFTIGKMGTRQNLLISEEEANRRGILIFESDRGGDITYHGPGQLIGYPIISLKNHRQDVKWYLEMLEETIIITLSNYGIQGRRIDGMTGVWVQDRKIASIGVRVEKWVTSHGFALNVNTDLNYFKLIVPCGIKDKGVTSMEKEIGRRFDLEEVASSYYKSFTKAFGYEG
jgi:lipoate-protein ligase B